MTRRRALLRALALLGAACLPLGPLVTPAQAADAATLERDARAALDKLYATTPAAKVLAGGAQGILVFPNIIKAGVLVGGQFGEGVLLEHGKRTGVYNTAGASYGLQAGAQSFGYALFFMSKGALQQLSHGLEIGVGPSVVLVDEGVARNLTTTTAREDVYAFVFGQQGLMAGLGIQGNKITRLDK